MGALPWSRRVAGQLVACGMAMLYVNVNAPKKQKAAVVVTRGATWKQTVNNSRHSISQMLQ